MLELSSKRNAWSSDCPIVNTTPAAVTGRMPVRNTDTLLNKVGPTTSTLAMLSSNTVSRNCERNFPGLCTASNGASLPSKPQRENLPTTVDS